MSKSNIYEYEFLSTNFGFTYYYTYDLRIYYDFERPEVLVSQSCPTLLTPWPVACQVPLSMNSPGKNIGVGCHFILQGIFHNPRIKLMSPSAPALAGGFKGISPIFCDSGRWCNVFRIV